MITFKLRHASALFASVLGPLLIGSVNDRTDQSSADAGAEPAVMADRAAFESGRSAPDATAGTVDWFPHTVRMGENTSNFAGFATHRIDKHWRAQAYVVTSPDVASFDYGFGGGLSFTF